MTCKQGLQLGLALVSWSEGKTLEARDALGVDKNWYPFVPDCYEKINVSKGIEWRTVEGSLPLGSKHDL
jgi:hypothetical protein